MGAALRRFKDATALRKHHGHSSMVKDGSMVKDDSAGRAALVPGFLQADLTLRALRWKESLRQQ